MGILKLLNRYKDNEAGSFAVIFAVSIFVLFISVGVAVDTSSLQSKKTNMQDMADVAVLAAARSGETQLAPLTDIARQYVAANNTSGNDIMTTVTLTDNGRINVNVQGRYDTQFMSIFGADSIDIAAQAQAVLSADEIVNIALVLDTTGSMLDTTGSMNGAKLAALKIAAVNLIDTLDVFEPGKVNIAVIPFDHYVNVGTSNRDAPWLDVADDDVGFGVWHGCVGSRFAPWHQRVAHSNRDITGLMNIQCGQEILPLTANLDNVRNSINNLTAQGWTYIPSGLMWGWRALDNSAPLASVGGSANESDIVILMTDGANTRSKAGLTHNGWDAIDANITTANMCTNVKSGNVEIYTIAFEINDAPTQNLLRNCASTPTHYYDADNGSELEAAFSEIAQSLVQLRLTN